MKVTFPRVLLIMALLSVMFAATLYLLLARIKGQATLFTPPVSVVPFPAPGENGELSCVPAGQDTIGHVIKCSDGRILHG